MHRVELNDFAMKLGELAKIGFSVINEVIGETVAKELVETRKRVADLSDVVQSLVDDWNSAKKSKSIE
jgi:hypothetical protein